MDWDEIETELERIGPTSVAAHIDPTREYDGQDHTNYGKRGQTMIEGLTFRDLTDCFIHACYLSSGLPIEEWPGTVYDLPWDDMDIIAVSQNLSCEVERFMGIYPNVPRLLPRNWTDPHWCGPTLDEAVWMEDGHEGHCDERHTPDGDTHA